MLIIEYNVNLSSKPIKKRKANLMNIVVIRITTLLFVYNSKIKQRKCTLIVAYKIFNVHILCVIRFYYSWQALILE
jgi:hypothetical protein